MSSSKSSVEVVAAESKAMERDSKIKHEVLAFIVEYKSNLNREDLNHIRALVNFDQLSTDTKENIILSLIFGDIGKINSIRKSFA